jgi:hypothetical protein
MRHAAVLLAAAMFVSGCDRIFPRKPDMTLPPIADVRGAYKEQGFRGTVTLDGNIVHLRVEQDVEHLRRGGTLWARVGPYIFLFSPATKRILETWPGIAAVRVVTVLPDGTEIARATVAQGALREGEWRRSHNLLGHALQSGTEKPRHIDDLVRWGEQHTKYRYNPRFIPPRE